MASCRNFSHIFHSRFETEPSSARNPDGIIDMFTMVEDGITTMIVGISTTVNRPSHPLALDTIVKGSSGALIIQRDQSRREYWYF